LTSVACCKLVRSKTATQKLTIFLRNISLALLVTDKNLNIISPEFSLEIHQNDEILNSMDDWCKENLKDVADNSRKSEITESKAESMMLDFITNYIEAPSSSPLVRNT